MPIGSGLFCFIVFVYSTQMEMESVDIHPLMDIFDCSGETRVATNVDLQGIYICHSVFFFFFAGFLFFDHSLFFFFFRVLFFFGAAVTIADKQEINGELNDTAIKSDVEAEEEEEEEGEQKEQKYINAAVTQLMIDATPGIKFVCLHFIYKVYMFVIPFFLCYFFFGARNK